MENATDAVGSRGVLRTVTRRDGGDAVVEIGDDGPGIPAALQARIVELFFSARDVGQNSGLGLDITYWIVVAQHHRTIAVRSTPGHTVVTVRLPIAGDDTMGDAVAGAPR